MQDEDGWPMPSVRSREGENVNASLHRYRSSGARPPDKVQAKRRVRIVENTPKAFDSACHGICKGLDDLPSLPILAAGLAGEVKLQIFELADFVANPTVPGPFQIATDLEAGRAQQVSDLSRVDRLWELRLCIDLLRECLDSFDAKGEPRDNLSTAMEVLASVEELLRRTAELAFSHVLAEDGLLDNSELDNAGQLLKVLKSPDCKKVGGLTRCLLRSRLRISGLLEAVVGELTCWRSQPSDADLEAWQRWDRTYEQLARRALSQADSSGGHEIRCLEDLPVASCHLREDNDVHLVECMAKRTQVCSSFFGLTKS